MLIYTLHKGLMEGLGQTAALDLFASEGIKDVHVGMDRKVP